MRISSIRRSRTPVLAEPPSYAKLADKLRMKGFTVRFVGHGDRKKGRRMALYEVEKRGQRAIRGGVHLRDLLQKGSVW